MEKKFIHGEQSDIMISIIEREMKDRIYERVFEVEEGDIVLDIGATNGDFLYTIMNKKPLHCWAIEPVDYHFKNMMKNLYGYPVSFVKGGIDNTINYKLYEWEGHENYAKGIIFGDFVKEYCIEYIDFLKLDCEGNEYKVFIDENIDYLKNKVKKISLEVHLSNSELKEKFKKFRDYISNNFNTFKIHSLDGVDITSNLYNDNFINYYNEVLVYIDNRM